MNEYKLSLSQHAFMSASGLHAVSMQLAAVSLLKVAAMLSLDVINSS